MIKIGNFVFNVKNGGVDIEVEGKPYRFDPTESAKLAEYLDENRQEILRAIRADGPKPTINSPEWYAQKLNEAFESLPD